MRQLLIGLLAFSFFYSCTTSPNEENALTGTWKMIADQLVDHNGKVMAEDRNVDGLLIYTSNGKMSVQILWNSVRSKIMTDSIMKQNGMSDSLTLGLNSWTIEQARTIIDSYEAYYGDYSIDRKNNIVTHTIFGNLRPDKPGKLHKRAFRLSGDTLFLRDVNPAIKWQAAFLKVK